MLITFDQNDSPAFSYEEISTSGWDIRSPETGQRGHGQVDVETHMNAKYLFAVVKSQHKLFHSYCDIFTKEQQQSNNIYHE